MDLKQHDLKRFLVDSIPSRFQNISPAQFISVMASVFRTDGYEVEDIIPGPEALADLLARKPDASLVIRALRLPAEHLVGVGDIQKAASARTFYKTDQSWIITTSSFTPEAKEAADKLDIELWDWDAFYLALKQLFFEGKSHYEYAELNPTEVNHAAESADLRLKAKWQPEEGIGAEWYNLDVVISNNSNRHVYLHLDLPALIDSNKNQITADQWAENEFVAGIVYSGASVRTNALFKASRLGELPPGGRIMLTCHERSETPSTYHLSCRLKGEACYFVTYCYGRQSTEYQNMIRFRDLHLRSWIAGKIIIAIYYRLSPCLVELAYKSRIADRFMRSFTGKITKLIVASNHK